MESPAQSIFFLGATGYLGSQILINLARDFPQHHIKALVRFTTPERLSQLKTLHPNLSVVEGTLDEDIIIREHASKAEIVINAANSHHFPSVQSILAGLEMGSASRPGFPPVYIHVSGLGIISDNSRGELIENSKEWSDLGFNLADCPPQNTHFVVDKAVIAAGTRKENPVRTVILFPCWIYGIGNGGIQMTTRPLRNLMDMYQRLGYAGTWGAGRNVINNVHVLDVASACVAVFKAVLVGEADEGADGFYFAASTQPRISMQEWSAKLGDILYNKGLIKEGGSRPFPNEVIEPLGEGAWSLIGGSSFAKPERLARLGWEPEETLKLSLLDSLPGEVDAVLEDNARGTISGSSG